MKKTAMPLLVWLLWIARVWLVLPAFGILITSCYFYNPHWSPIPLLSPQLGQTVFFGGIVLAIAGIAWQWPVAGGLIAITYSIYMIWIRGMVDSNPFAMIPYQAYLVLYGNFIIGSIFHFLVRLRLVATPYSES